MIGARFNFAALFAGLCFFWFSVPGGHAQAQPAGCTGGGLGILLFTDAPQVHIGGTINYSITVFNGLCNGPVVCDATGIKAFVVTPDLVSHTVTLGRTNLANGQMDYYSNVVSYVVRTQDLRTDGTVRATASDTGVIQQNDTASLGGGNQGVNTEVGRPGILISVRSVRGIGENGAITFSGLVSNSGNNPLVNVTVTNFVNGGQYAVAVPPNLAIGQSAAFRGSWAPVNSCIPSTATLTALGTDQFPDQPATVTYSASTTGTDLLKADIKVTRACSVEAVAPGQWLSFTGSVSNSGNVTLTGIVVVSDQPVSNSPVFTLAVLAPHAATNFTGGFPAPTNCSVKSLLTATGRSLCGADVTNTAAGTCAILTAPAIVVTQTCPLTAAEAGGLLTYSGTVSNAGNIALNNVIVRNNLTGVTPVFTAVTLAPGVVASFTGSYVAPFACATSGILTATAKSPCGVAVIGRVTTTCPLQTMPVFVVTQSGLTNFVLPGGLANFSGTISNTGDVTLTNIVVTSEHPTNKVVFTWATLLPGARASFRGSFIAPVGSTATTNSTIVTNRSSSITTNLVSQIITNSSLVVTTNPPTATTFGTIDSVSQTVVDWFAIGTNFQGLTYADEDHGYGATEFYSLRQDVSGTAYFDTIIASTATTTDRFATGQRTFDALTYAAPDVGYGPVIFYYLSHDPAGVSTFGSITPGGATGVVADHFVVGSNFNALTFAATDVGYGANLFYYVRHDATGLSTFGTIDPAQPGSITDRFAVGSNVDALVFTALAAPGYGANNFYYLRHNTNGGSTLGTILVTGLTNATVTDRFNVGSNATELTFTATDAGSFGPNLFYFLRSRGPGFTTNVVTTFTTNAATTFTTNTLTSYTTNAVVSFSTGNTLTATGRDGCEGRIVGAATDSSGLVAPAWLARTELGTNIIPGPTGTNGSFSSSFPTEIGKLYTVQFKNDLSNLTWTDLETVVGTGGYRPITDVAGAGQPSRFYRVIATP